MNNARETLYQDLRREIGNTPLCELTKIQFPRGNRVFAKEEYANPGGSHYDRVFLPIFRHYEEQGKIVPGVTPVVETSSGSAGVSFARTGRLLGYECLVICPEDLPQSRLHAVEEQGAELRLTPKGQYIDGSAQELARIFREENRERKKNGKMPYFGLNHSQNPAASIAASSVESAVDEAVSQAAQIGVKFDIAIAAGGNGTTALGFGRAAGRYGFPLVIWEPLSSGLYFDRKFGNQIHDYSPLEWKFGIKPGELREGGGVVYGMTYGPTVFGLPNIDRAIEEGVVDYVRIATDEKTRQAALHELRMRQMDAPLMFGQNDTLFRNVEMHRANVQRLPSWGPALELLRDTERKPVGWSSAGNIAMVMDESWRIKDMNVLTFFYDSLSRY